MEQCGLDGLTDLIAKPQRCSLMSERQPGGSFLGICMSALFSN